MFQAQCRHWYSEIRSSQARKSVRDLNRQLLYGMINTEIEGSAREAYKRTSGKTT